MKLAVLKSGQALPPGCKDSIKKDLAERCAAV